MITLKLVVSAVVFIQLWFSSVSSEGTAYKAAKAPMDCSQCGKKFNCFFPYGMENCEGFGATFKTLPGDLIDLHLYHEFGTPFRWSYIAVGFNMNNTMGGAFVIECSTYGETETTPSFKFSVNEKYNNKRINGAEALRKTHFTDTTFKVEDKFMHCHAKVNVKDPVLPSLDLKAKHFILGAWGSTVTVKDKTESHLAKHEMRGISKEAMLLSLPGAEGSDQKPADSGSDNEDGESKDPESDGDAPEKGNDDEAKDPEGDGGSEEKETDAAAVHYSSLALLIAILLL